MKAKQVKPSLQSIVSNFGTSHTHSRSIGSFEMESIVDSLSKDGVSITINNSLVFSIVKELVCLFMILGVLGSIISIFVGVMFLISSKSNRYNREYGKRSLIIAGIGLFVSYKLYQILL